MEANEQCVICGQSVDGTGSLVSTLGEKGSASLNKASVTRGDSIKSVPGDKVHKECRRSYTRRPELPNDLRPKDREPSTIRERRTRSSSAGEFCYKTDCLFCGTPAAVRDKIKWPGLPHNVAYPFRTVDKESLLTTCSQRKDDWSETVQARILHVHDLHAADAVYHLMCSVNFRTNKQIPQSYQTDTQQSKRIKVGRPEDDERTVTFLELAKYIEENDDEQITVNDLVDLMQQKLADCGSEAYTYTYMKKKLQDHFGEKIIFTDINGKQNVVTMRTTAKVILQDYYATQQKETNTNEEKLNLLKAAAQILKQDIKDLEQSKDSYPSVDEIESPEASIKFLPDTLRLFLEEVFVGAKTQIKIAAIGQAIMQAARPRVLLAPLQFSLAVQLYHHFSSRFLIDTLHGLGFCCSYQEVHQFERNASVSQGTEISGLSTEFIQYVADNVDHNIRTLDGLGTFHGMGMIATVTPRISLKRIIPRIKVTPMDVAAVGKVEVRYLRDQMHKLTPLRYQRIENIQVESSENLDILWKTSILFRAPRPAWSGMMQLIHKGDHPGKSSVMFLPMIDMNPGDSTCIYSTLTYICDHAKRHNVTPIITFDQPLWWKALEIVNSQPEDSNLRQIVLRLGGFHLEMSFLGCIGHLMASSGLQNVLELIYAPNAVIHMMSGKAVARAVRGHSIVDAALNGLFLADVFNVHLPQTTGAPDNSVGGDTEFPEAATAMDVSRVADLDEAKKIFEKLMDGTVSSEEASQFDVLVRIKDCLKKHIESTKMTSRTSALWVQYMEMQDILRKHICAERTGNWSLHLQVIQDMLPYLAAAGHNLYTKCARVYLQQMLNLKTEHPNVQQHFEEGLHVIRRSDRLWAGLSPDLVIEQVLMRSMKTSGGLTRGRGMTEQQRLLWLLSMPACAEVNQAMEALTGVNLNTGEQNQDMTEARLARDWKDTLTVLTYLQERNPFKHDPSLCNIATGEHAHSNVNVDTAQAVGTAILRSMDGHSPSEYTFKRRHQAVTLGMKSSVKIDGDQIQVDPQLLFQRLVIVAQKCDELESALKYELCSYPPALFDSSLLLREANKPALADAIWKHTGPDVSADNIVDGCQYILDGGALLQRIPWSIGSTYTYIFHQYTQYVVKKYGNAVVVFDGYLCNNTKDMTHQRRSKGRIGATVTFTADMTLTMKKDEFLTNRENKQKFIFMLSAVLQKANCETYHASGDADLLIVQKAVQCATTNKTVLIGEDTDLLVLLCHHASLKSCDLFLCSEMRKNTKKPHVWNIKATKQLLGPDVCKHILFLHAVLGCDTTSRLHGIGKGASLKKFKESAKFREQADVFFNNASSKDDVARAGEKALVILYNGKRADTLDSLRYHRFCEKVASSSTHIEPQVLPPTSGAARFHSLRVYLQVQEWKASTSGTFTFLLMQCFPWLLCPSGGGGVQGLVGFRRGEMPSGENESLNSAFIGNLSIRLIKERESIDI